MNTPSIQYAIRLVNFFVTSVNMTATDPNDKKLTESLKVNIGYGLGFNEIKLNSYLVNFNIDLSNKNKSFLLELKASALFESTEDIDDDFKNSVFVQTNSPAIAFPFLRSFINTLTTNAGINPVILPAFNFSKQEKK